jgi:hypothetical protein
MGSTDCKLANEKIDMLPFAQQFLWIIGF